VQRAPARCCLCRCSSDPAYAHRHLWHIVAPSVLSIDRKHNAGSIINFSHPALIFSWRTVNVSGPVFIMQRTLTDFIVQDGSCTSLSHSSLHREPAELQPRASERDARHVAGRLLLFSYSHRSAASPSSTTQYIARELKRRRFCLRIARSPPVVPTCISAKVLPIRPPSRAPS
jgi:hypothetical protein